MKTLFKRFVWMLGLAAVAWVAQGGATGAMAAEVSVQKRRSWSFDGGGLAFTNDFPGARLVDARSGSAPGEYRLVIDREGPGVSNASAWYAFAIDSKRPRALQLTLAYAWARHRYSPKIRIGETGPWVPVPSAQVQPGAERNEVVLLLDVPAGRVYVAGEPMLTLAEQATWANGLTKAHSFVKRRDFGKSVAGRSLAVLETNTAKAPDAGTVIVMTWQHPPEFSGVRAFRAFVETLLGGSETARTFREKYNLVIVPAANPDGVHEGHWRNNLGDVDLNRDWKRFSQPETRALRDLFKATRSPALFFDFHSTKKTIFYTNLDEEASVRPSQFTKLWTEAMQKRFRDEEIERDTGHNPDADTSRVWAADALGVPAITIELADEATPEFSAVFGQASAEEMMRLLLASPPAAR